MSDYCIPEVFYPLWKPKIKTVSVNSMYRKKKLKYQ